MDLRVLPPGAEGTLMTSPVRLGIAGWGMAAREMVKAAAAEAQVRVTCVADVDAERRQQASAAGMPRVCATMADLCGPDVDVVYIATPTPLHADQTLAALSLGKHVIVEKPMAASVADARRMADAAAQAKCVLLVGATASYHAPVRALRDLVLSGALGKLRAMSNWCHTNWLRRPRKPSDLDPLQGGGVVFRQGAHQFDLMRYVCGGLAASVYATAVSSAVSDEAGYTAIVSFEGGAQATGIYGAHGGFDSRFLSLGIGELGERITFAPDDPRSRLLPDTGDGLPAAPRFGFTLASFDHGDVVMSRQGLLAFEGESVREVPAPGPSGWPALLAELTSVLNGAAPEHDGYWGCATLEICEAVQRSCAARASVGLWQQVPLNRHLH
jgi:phthalate 4,5-cis-dihydrodiol dehydrogenase